MSDDLTDTQARINKNFWDIYHSSTTTISSLCRQLGYVEGGICWFYITANNPLKEIKLILIILSIFFFLDIFQYLSTAIIFWLSGKYYERQCANNNIPLEKIVRRWWMNLIPLLFFISKIFTLGYASHNVLNLLLKI